MNGIFKSFLVSLIFVVTVTISPAYSGDINPCDELAADPDDPKRVTKGVDVTLLSLEQLTHARQACSSAYNNTDYSEDKNRYFYQAARLTEVGAKIFEATDEELSKSSHALGFEAMTMLADKFNYPAAQYSLAWMADTEGNFPSSDRRKQLLKAAALNGHKKAEIAYERDFVEKGKQNTPRMTKPIAEVTDWHSAYDHGYAYEHSGLWGNLPTCEKSKAPADKIKEFVDINSLMFRIAGQKPPVGTDNGVSTTDVVSKNGTVMEVTVVSQMGIDVLPISYRFFRTRDRCDAYVAKIRKETQKRQKKQDEIKAAYEKRQAEKYDKFR